MVPPSYTPARQQLSLLWKILLPCLLIFAAITGVMVWQSWRMLNAQLEAKTLEQLDGDQRVLASLFGQLRSEYGHIGTELAGVVDRQDGRRLQAYIENSPDIFARLNWMGVYRLDGERLGGWAPLGVEISVPVASRETLLKRAGLHMQPVGGVYCGESGCEYLLAMPGHAEADPLFLILAAPLSELLPLYAELTNGDLAVVLRGQPGGSLVAAHTLQRRLDETRVLDLTGGTDGESAAGEDWFRDSYMAYKLVDLSPFAAPGQDLQAVLLRDLTQRRAYARQQAAQQLLIEVLLVLLGVLALFAIISRSLNRLRRVTGVLPSLSETERYAQTRESLRMASPPSLFGDEVDALRDTLSWLSERLESLHGAEAASEAKSRFLATMSHEIRTPMSGILGLTEILSRAPMNADQKRMAVMIHESTVNLLGIINDVLDYSRLEAGAAELDLVEFDPTDLLESVAELVAVTAVRKNLQLQVLASRELPRLVRGDQGKLRQILLNLVSNAIKFTEQGRVSLRAQVERRNEHGVELIFEVEDTGIGVPEEAQARIFQRFSQADSSTTRRFGGTGLGLAICEGLAELMGGRIGLRSEPGRGSCFSLRMSLPELEEAAPAGQMLQGFAVELQLQPEEAACWGAHLQAEGAELRACVDGEQGPCITLSESPDGDNSRVRCRVISDGAEEQRMLDRPVNPSDLPQLLGRSVHGQEGVAGAQVADERTQFAARVLIAEDQPVNRDLLERQLAQLGCEVLAVPDGEDALALLQSGELVDLLITDLHMPKMDGYQLAHAVRQSDEAQINSLPIVVLTASASPQDLSRLQRHGVNRKLVKPVRIADLEHCLRDLGMSLAGGQAEAAPQGVAEPGDEEAMVLDLDLVRDVMGDDLSILETYAKMFEETTLPLFEQCEAALAVEDYAELKELVHRIKGSSRSLGGLRLAARLVEVERAAESHADGLADMLAEAKKDFAVLMEALQAAV